MSPSGVSCALPGSLGALALLPQPRFASLGHWCDPGTTGHTCAVALTLAGLTASTQTGAALFLPSPPHRLQGPDKSLSEPSLTAESYQSRT